MMRVRAGQIIGRDHMARQANAQDAYALAEQDGCVIGVVCDGCGEGANSEVGAKLAAAYMVGQAASLISGGTSLEALPGILHQQTVSFLDYLVVGMQPAHRTQFIRDHLLFTVVGVVVSEREAVVFSAGDGLVAIDDDVTSIDQDNKPAYIAYHLLDAETLGGFVVPASFAVWRQEAWSRLAVATDGFERELLPEVWGQAHPRGLQRKLNKWSNVERRFHDDATLITVERVSDDDEQRQD